MDTSMYPARRRPRGPLHPSNRAPPPAPSSSASVFASSSNPPSSVFLDSSTSQHSRKRNWTPSSYSPADASPSSARTATQNSHRYFGADSRPQVPSPESFMSEVGASTSAPTYYSSLVAPSETQPSRPPQGEFSFQPPVSGLDSAHPDGGAHDSAAFARLAKAQRQQREEQRKLLTGQAEPRSISSDADDVQGPAPKKRRGVAGAIVDGALNAALYTGAAAITAYSLWSSWGRRPDEEDEDARPIVSNNNSEEKLPPGGLEEPPPPYAFPPSLSSASSSSRTKIAEAPLSPQAASSSSSFGLSSPRNNLSNTVFVSGSSRGRRRPAYPSHRSVRSQQQLKRPKASTLFQQQNVNNTDSNEALHNDYRADRALDDNDDDEGDDDDEMFRRFQSKMSNLIAEGQAALSAKVDLGNMDIEEDDHPFSSLSGGGIVPSRSEPVFALSSDTPRINQRSVSNNHFASHAAHPPSETTTTTTPLPSRFSTPYRLASQEQPFVFGKESSGSIQGARESGIPSTSRPLFSSSSQPRFGSPSLGGSSTPSRIPRAGHRLSTTSTPRRPDHS